MENLIELLDKKTPQLPDWKFRELVVEKINEIAAVLNNKTNDEKIVEETEEEREERERLGNQHANSGNGNPSI